MNQRYSSIRANNEEKQIEMKSAFNLFDLDNDGKISIEDFGTIISMLGESLTYKEIRSIFKEAKC